MLTELPRKRTRARTGISSSSFLPEPPRPVMDTECCSDCSVPGFQDAGARPSHPREPQHHKATGSLEVFGRIWEDLEYL